MTAGAGGLATATEVLLDGLLGLLGRLVIPLVYKYNTNN